MEDHHQDSCIAPKAPAARIKKLWQELDSLLPQVLDQPSPGTADTGRQQELEQENEAFARDNLQLQQQLVRQQRLLTALLQVDLSATAADVGLYLGETLIAQLNAEMFGFWQQQPEETTASWQWLYQESLEEAGITALPEPAQSWLLAADKLEQEVPAAAPTAACPWVWTCRDDGGGELGGLALYGVMYKAVELACLCRHGTLVAGFFQQYLRWWQRYRRVERRLQTLQEFYQLLEDQQPSGY